MTTVKRFIDRLGTQKSRSCQKKHKACDTLKDIERSTKPVETAKIHRVWVAYCMWNSHLFILFINPKANIWKKEGGKRNQYFLRRKSGSERFKLLNFLHSGAFWHFFQKTTSLQTGFRLCTSVFKIISNSHRGHTTQLLTLETECWNDVLHNKGYLAHTQLIAHKPIVTYLYTKYCSHIVSCYSHRK